MAQEIPLPKGVLDSPLTLLSFYDDDVSEGRLILDNWQMEMLHFFGQKHEYNDPVISAMLLAANGAGKSQLILAPIAIWFCMKYIESLTYITTASGRQLDTQNLRYCTRLANKINTYHRNEFPEGIIKCQYRKFENIITEAHIDMIATDDGGKAEGKHPLTFNGKFLLMMDECKSITEEIYVALEKCTGYTHRLEITSAGAANGNFYVGWNSDDTSIFRKRVTAFDCTHLKKDGIDKLIRKHGLQDPLIRNMIFSEFSSVGQSVVIQRELFIKSISLADKFYDFGPLRAGLDLAAGGDENALTVWKGNKEIETHSFKFQDTSETVEKIIDIIKTYKGTLEPKNIYADDGGVGRGILDNFREKGYAFTRVLNQARPFDVTRYINRGTELWFSFKRFIEEYQVLFLKDSAGNVDKELLKQFTNRYYKQPDNNKLLLESKQNQKKNRNVSPDRADAVVLAWSSLFYPVPEMQGCVRQEIIKANGSDSQTFQNFINDKKYEEYNKRLEPHKQIPSIPKLYNAQQMLAHTKPSMRHSDIYKPNGTKYAMRGLPSKRMF